MDDFHVSWVFLIPIVAIIGSFTYVIVLTLSRARVRELEMRERIAMIERGLVPPPESRSSRVRSGDEPAGPARIPPRLRGVINAPASR